MAARQIRDERIPLRVTAEQKQTIEAAARTLGRTTTDFAVNAAMERAEDTLADRRTFFVDDDQWDSFVDTLSAPLPQVSAERLQRTLAARAIFKQP